MNTFPTELTPTEISDDEYEIEQVLAQRKERYGEFLEQAAVSCALKRVMRSTKNWERLKPDQQEALEMFAVKISRILTGDPDYIDNWLDKEGYARLVKKRLQREQQEF